MKYTILEDASPYFIRYKHQQISNLVAVCIDKIPLKKFQYGFKHLRMKTTDAVNILKYVPENDMIDLNLNRVSLFITEPGKYYGAHKDGYPKTMFSINYPILIQDNLCVTSWYDDEEINRYNYVVNRNASENAGLGSENANSREIQNFIKERHIPSKTMIANLGEGILFNTDIYHDWDNRESKNRRVVLTLRYHKPHLMSFKDAKKILFGL